MLRVALSSMQVRGGSWAGAVLARQLRAATGMRSWSDFPSDFRQRADAVPASFAGKPKLLKIEELLQIAGAAGDGPGEGEFGHVVGKYAVDAIEFCAAERLRRL